MCNEYAFLWVMSFGWAGHGAKVSESRRFVANDLTQNSHILVIVAISLNLCCAFTSTTVGTLSNSDSGIPSAFLFCLSVSTAIFFETYHLLVNDFPHLRRWILRRFVDVRDTEVPPTIETDDTPRPRFY